MNDVLDIEGASAYLHVSRAGLYKLARQGKVPGFKLGTVWRFQKDSLDKWIQERIQEDTASRSIVKPKKKPVKKATSKK